MSLRDSFNKAFSQIRVKRTAAPADVTVVTPVPAKRSFKRIRVSALAAAYLAWRAVRANVNIVEYLGAHLEAFWRDRPRTSQPVPRLWIGAHGELMVEEALLHPIHRLLVDPTSGVDDRDEQTVVAAETAIERAQSDTVSAVQAGDLEDAERKGAAAEQRRRQLRAEREELETLSSDALVASTTALQNGSVTPAPAPERPPSLFLIVTVYLGMGVLLLTELAQIAAPLLNSAGIDTSAIDREFWRAPVTVSMWTAAAVGLTLALFAVGGIAIDRAAHVRFELTRRQLFVNIALATGMGAIVAAVLAIIAAMRANLAEAAAAATASLYGTAAAKAPSGFAFFVLALVTILASALLHRIARHLQKKRAELHRAAATRTAEQVAAEGRTTLLEKIDAELADVEAQIDESRERVRALMLEGQVHHEVRRERAHLDFHAVEQFVDDVRAAIAKHRIAFIHAAKKRKRLNLLRADAPLSVAEPLTAEIVPYEVRGHR